MSIHAPPSPEALRRLQRQRRTCTISSIVVSVLSVVLIALILGIFLLPNLIKETPVIVTYTSSLMGKPVGKLATEMTKKTGGQTIEVIPGKK